MTDKPRAPWGSVRHTEKEDRAPRGTLSPEEARLRKNERQREYAKRTGYAASIASQKKNTKNISFRLSFSTDADIIDRLDKVENTAGYLKRLIREDMVKNP